MARLRYNGLATGAAGSTVGLTLGASLTNIATSVTFSAALTYGNGTAVPTITGSDYIPLEILDTNGHVSEIVWLTAYTAAATTGTIARGKEGTAGVAHSSGDKVIHGATVFDVAGYAPGSADIPPIAPNAKDDEFDGSSSVTWTNGPTAPTTFDRNSTRPHHAFLRSNGNTANAVVVYQSTPSTPFTITAKIAAAHHGVNNYASVILTTASPTGSSPLYIMGADSPSSSTTQVDRQKWTTFATSGFSTASGVNFANLRGPWYIKVVVNSTSSVDAYASTDGYAWMLFESAFNPGFTIGSMGLGVVEGSGADMSAYFDFFRIT